MIECKLYPNEGGYREPITIENRQWWDLPNAEFRWRKCPNLKSVYEGWESETYACENCGYRYTLYDDEMK